MLDAREGWFNFRSYLAARSNKRLLVNSSALSARLRQRAACCFKKELSIYPPDATNGLILHSATGTLNSFSQTPARHSAAQDSIAQAACRTYRISSWRGMILVWCIS